MTNLISQAVATVKNWWLILLTGILLIIGSIMTFAHPGETLVALAWLFSFLVFATGIAYVYFAITNREYLEGWGWYLAGGIFEIILGILLIANPELSAASLPFVVGFWFLFRSVQIIAASLDLKDLGVMDWGWIMLFGIALGMMAFFMLLDPIFGFLNVVYLTGLGLMFFGISHAIIAFKLKKLKSKTIDKVDDFKKDVKKGFKDLKKEIEKQLDDLTDEQKAKMQAAFDEYKE